MQAISTKYIPATDRRGSRIKATAYRKSIMVPYDDTQGVESAHHKAFQALAEKLGWLDMGTWYVGGCPSGKGNVYVCSPKYASSFVNIVREG